MENAFKELPSGGSRFPQRGDVGLSASYASPSPTEKIRSFSRGSRKGRPLASFESSREERLPESTQKCTSASLRCRRITLVAPVSSRETSSNESASANNG